MWTCNNTVVPEAILSKGSLIQLMPYTQRLTILFRKYNQRYTKKKLIGKLIGALRLGQDSFDRQAHTTKMKGGKTAGNNLLNMVDIGSVDNSPLSVILYTGVASTIIM